MHLLKRGARIQTLQEGDENPSHIALAQTNIAISGRDLLELWTTCSLVTHNFEVDEKRRELLLISQFSFQPALWNWNRTIAGVIFAALSRIVIVIFVGLWSVWTRCWNSNAMNGTLNSDCFESQTQKWKDTKEFGRPDDSLTRTLGIKIEWWSKALNFYHLRP